MLRLLVSGLLLSAALAGTPLSELRSNLEVFEDGRNTNIDEPAYRLLDTVQPTDYFVNLDVHVAEGVFTGEVTIVVNTSTSLNQLVLHSNVAAITGISVSDFEGSTVHLRQPDFFELDPYFELLKINFEEEIPAGTYTLKINYDGQINENQFDRGFYRGYYFLDGEKRYYATTQFQPVHARKAFPCFDEPQFKSRFIIAITRPSSFSPSYSNMAISTTEVLDNNRTREIFLPTPIISAYLIAFHVSDFVETNPGSTAERPVGIISRPGPVSQHTYAGVFAASLTSWMDSYFDFNYYDMGQGVPMKNDHIALPDFPSGAMENWGMVNYREAYLLYDENNTNIVNKIFISTIIAHEMAHKWFGNLVTCFWWSNLWLNESFASYFEYFGPNGVDVSLELEEQFVVDYVHSALLGDSGAGAWAMNHPPVASNPSISAHFSTSSYAKGASVLRMMEHLVGASTFQKALQYYLRDNAYGLGTPQLMYNAFTSAVVEDSSMTAYDNTNIAAVFQSWVDLPGYPVLNVDVDMSTGRIALRQERFLINGQEGTGVWQIPLTYTRANDINWSDTKPIKVLTTETDEIEKPGGHEWVIFNVAQSGYYRVNYDDHSWEMIASALRNNRESIHKLNRAQIVNDVLNFLRAGKISATRAFDVLEFLGDETDYYVWAGVITPLEWIRRRFIHIPQLLQEFEEYILEQMETVIQHLGYDERDDDSTTTILNRMQIMNLACNLGHEGCISDSQAKWDAWKANEDQQQVPVNLRRYVYCTGVRYGETEDFQFLWRKYQESENTADMVVMLRALGCTRNSNDLTTYLTETTSNDLIRYHDRTNAFSFALQGNQDNIQTVLEFVEENYEAIREGYGGSARLSVALNALTTYLNNYDDVLKFQTWLYNNQQSIPGEFSTGQGVINSATNNINWGNNIVLDIRGVLKTRSSAHGIVASITLLFSVVLLQILK